MTSKSLLAVPFRHSEPIDLGAGLISYLKEKLLIQITSQISKECDTIDKQRNRILNISPHLSSLESLFLYYANFTTSVMTKFPSDSIAVKFVWHGTLGYTEAGGVRSSSSRFEQLNVLFCIAALYTNLATLQTFSASNDLFGKTSIDSASNDSDSKAIKLAYSYLQNASACFRYMIDEILPKLEQSPPLDLDANTLETLYYMCLAQAQELFWAKATMGDNAKNSLVSKLAMKVSDYYSETLIYAQRSPNLKAEWINHLACKKWYALASAYYRSSAECLSKSKYGEEIARLRQALQACTAGLSQSRYVSPIVVEDLKQLQAKAKEALKRAESDNDLIYLQEVPVESSLSEIKGISMVNPSLPEAVANPVQYLEKTKRCDLLFTSVLPYVIYQTANTYKEKLLNHVEIHFKKEVKDIDTKHEKVLHDLNLPGALEAVEKPVGLPDSLIAHINEIRDMGGISRIEQSLMDIRKLALSSRHLLQEGQETLNYENKEDMMMRESQGTQRWARATSKEAGAELWSTLEKMQELLNQAAEGDKTILENFNSSKRNIQLLSQGQETIEKMIPESTSILNSNQYFEHVTQELKECLLKSRGLKLLREEFVKNMLNLVRNMDILSQNIKLYNEMLRSGKDSNPEAKDFEMVYNENLRIVERQEKKIEELREQQEIQNERIKQLYKEFEAVKDTDDTNINRENAIQGFEVAFHEYKKIIDNLEQGRQFYNQLLEQLHAAIDQCKQFVYFRRVEGRELEMAITNRSLQQLRVDNPVVEADDDEGNYVDEDNKQQQAEQLTTDQYQQQQQQYVQKPNKEEAPSHKDGRRNQQQRKTWQPSDGIRFA